VVKSRIEETMREAQALKEYIATAWEFSKRELRRDRSGRGKLRAAQPSLSRPRLVHDGDHGSVKHDVPRTGLGFAIVLAALTLAVVIVSGLFLIYQSGTAPAPLEFAAPSRIAGTEQPKAPHPDHSHARHGREARLPRLHHRVRA
jgi:hypothetical protein